MLRPLLVILLALFAPFVWADDSSSRSPSTIYWPVLSPSPTTPWILGQKNLLSWRTVAGTGIAAFDIELRNWNRKVMEGSLKLAYSMPMKRLPGGYGNYGGDIEVDLSGVPSGDGFVVAFVDSLKGRVWSVSAPFSIEKDQPSNYTAPSGSAQYSATLTAAPGPTDQWATTLDGSRPMQTDLGY